jgi:hypothetical protein
MSMAFQVHAQRWDDDYTDRRILSLGLHKGDVSVVTFGASETTSSSIRSEAAALALADLGNEIIVSALVEWRDYTLLPLEQREGKTLSAATREVLSNVAGMIDDAGGCSTTYWPCPPDSDEAGDTVERSITTRRGCAQRSAPSPGSPGRTSGARRSSSARASSNSPA